MLDSLDLQIIECLKENARAQWKEVGSKVHLTGQAVADRVHRLEDLGFIAGYTVQLDETRLKTGLTVFITVFMKTNEHTSFQALIQNKQEIKECHRISGEGCYWLRAHLPCHEALNALLDEILPFGNYRLSMSISKLK
ncbi:MAG: Lrp/AsnC family transcriptional regulator [Pelosinus sp.]|nr:Lrp/AsnC family transcriptional regulator [Pelosinus sp.]